jgi:AraC-like DNA-binding protein
MGNAMLEEEAAFVYRWSTDNVPPRQRLDAYVGSICERFINCTTTTRKKGEFRSALDVCALGVLKVANMRGDTQDSFRTARDIARSKEQALHLLLSTSGSWKLRYPDRTIYVGEGDVVLIDTRIEHSVHWGEDCSAVNVKMPIEWTRTWLPAAEELAGRPICKDAGWGGILSKYLRQLDPISDRSIPISAAVMADQVGALLALAIHERDGSALAFGSRYAQKREQIVSCIRQQCCEPQVGASEVARSVGISVRTLHRILAAFGETFGGHLMDARANVALRMLQSKAFANLTLADIGFRAGFLDASHFARICRERFGKSPTELRRS